MTKSPKSKVLSIVLTLFFGPIGLFYSTVTGGLIMTFCLSLTGYSTDFNKSPLSLGWIICIAWGVAAVDSYNAKIQGEILLAERRKKAKERSESANSEATTTANRSELLKQLEQILVLKEKGVLSDKEYENERVIIVGKLNDLKSQLTNDQSKTESKLSDLKNSSNQVKETINLYQPTKDDLNYLGWALIIVLLLTFGMVSFYNKEFILSKISLLYTTYQKSNNPIEGTFSNSLMSIEFVKDKAIMKTHGDYMQTIERVYEYSVDDGYVYIKEALVTERFKIIDSNTIESSDMIRLVRNRKLSWEEIEDVWTKECENILQEKFSKDKCKIICNCTFQKIKGKYPTTEEIQNVTHQKRTEIGEKFFDDCIKKLTKEDTQTNFEVEVPIPPTVIDENISPDDME